MHLKQFLSLQYLNLLHDKDLPLTKLYLPLVQENMFQDNSKAYYFNKTGLNPQDVYWACCRTANIIIT